MITDIKKIAIGCDHAGYELKEKLKIYLQQHGYEAVDKGTHSLQSVDYPDFAHLVANDVADANANAGILICGSANGVAITANKHNNIRAAICWTAEIAHLARQHNDANILCIPTRFVSIDIAIEMLRVFLHTDFEGGRHQTRVEKINCN
jgi:ribose 5-phosphate isomerase B